MPLVPIDPFINSMKQFICPNTQIPFWFLYGFISETTFPGSMVTTAFKVIVTPKIVPAVSIVGALVSPLSLVHEDSLCIYDDTCSSLPGDCDELDVDLSDDDFEPILDSDAPVIEKSSVFQTRDSGSDQDDLESLFLELMGM
jgi:hypothetical protein